MLPAEWGVRQFPVSGKPVETSEVSVVLCRVILVGVGFTVHSLDSVQCWVTGLPTSSGNERKEPTGECTVGRWKQIL